MSIFVSSASSSSNNNNEEEVVGLNNVNRHRNNVTYNTRPVRSSSVPNITQISPKRRRSFGAKIGSKMWSLLRRGSSSSSSASRARARSLATNDDSYDVEYEDNFDNNNFKFGTAKYISIKEIKIWTQRLSYVGELGFELYVKFEEAKKIYDLLIEKGKDFNLSNCGMHAMDIMRMESGFLHWGHDISPEENQYQAGLNFAISYKKNMDFIGKDALLKIKDQKPTKQFIMLSLKDSKPGEPLLLHDEPIYLEDKIIGRTTSGNYSFNYKKNMSFGYINSGNSIKEIEDKKLFIEVEKQKYPVNLELKPLKDKNIKLT